MWSLHFIVSLTQVTLSQRASGGRGKKERARERGGREGGREDGWMDGWMEGGREAVNAIVERGRGTSGQKRWKEEDVD